VSINLPLGGNTTKQQENTNTRTGRKNGTSPRAKNTVCKNQRLGQQK